MTALRINTILFMLTTIFGCNNNSKSVKASVVDPKRADAYSWKPTQTLQYGDSLRVEITQNGNHVFRNYIDLKKGKDDGFDNSYTVESDYSTRYVDSFVTRNGDKIKIKAMLAETYKTEFSAGTNYYMLTDKNDTILLSHFLDYIK